MTATPREEMERIARKLWGEPNRAQSRRDELRFGTNGSKSVDLRNLEWFDHEAQKGGGLALLCILAGEPVPSHIGSDNVVSIYGYRNEHGAPLFQVVRRIPKKFVQRHADPSQPDGWAWNIRGVQRVLYRLPELLATDASLPVFICEGEKDVDALRARGLVATCNPGGAGKWRRDFAEYLRGRDVVILPDNDQAGHDHAADVRKKLQGVARSIRALELPGLAEKGDVSDWLAAGGTAEALRALVASVAVAADDDGGNGKDGAPVSPPDIEIEAEIARLAQLSLLKFEQQCSASAKLLGLRVGILRKLVAIERGDSDTKGQGRPLDLPPPEPWPEPVDGAAMLYELADYFATHLVLPAHGNHALALWASHCHCFDAFPITPRLQLKSVVKQSGKSTGIDLLKQVTPKAIEVETVSPSFIFRAIERVRPTLLLDEADRYLKDKNNAELVAVVNAGAKRGATAGRCWGDNQEPRLYDCHAPVALAGIGTLPGTIEDRAIQIVMKRRMRDELVQPFDDAAMQKAERLQRQAARWCADRATELRDVRPDMAPLFNRAADRWRALYAIAEVAGGEWPKLVRETMQAVTVMADDDADNLAERLLADVKQIFDDVAAEDAERRKTEPSHTIRTELPTAKIVDLLVEMLDRPWPEMGKSRKPLTATRLTQMLGRFRIPRSRLGKDGDSSRPWGYRLTDFDDAFRRHLDA